MKKIGLIFREASESRIKGSLKESNAVFILKYSGVASPGMSTLRQGLKKSKADIFVVKNSIARRALKDSNLQALLPSLEGPCGLVFVKDEPVGPSKVICDFIKSNENLKLAGGFLKDKILEKKDIEEMSRLPSKEVLRAQLVMALNSPISGLVITLNQILAKFVYCLEEIRKKKGS